ncbi:DUF6160 family protein [Zestomonas carbonaria]|uniref:DUF6160 domain-containing protein n=1 Tax=Zestomonas carbonaria TaxID=2762745 RepID=A0A7U7EN13_9GAMM|nr:DUF6160 family protein [Pseudomonas carbonaria]CAD5107881.1 hypothetical protein PSEWESI4_02161 [Pseudomonas carbonaria]
MRRTLLFLPLLLSPLAQAMQALDDDSLASVSGRDGISMETTGPGWSAGSISYIEDGQTLSFKGVSGRPQDAASKSTTTLDVEDDRLRIEHSSRPQVLSVDNIEMAGSTKSFGSMRAFYSLGYSLKLKGGGASGVSGFAVSDSHLSLRDVTFYYRDNGFDLIVNGLSFDTYLNNAYLDIVNGGSGQEIQLSLGDTRLVGQIGGLGLDLAHGDPAGQVVTPGAPDTRDPNHARSLGQIKLDLNLGGSLSIGGGGASGEGLRIRPNLSIANSLFEYRDDGVLRAENFSGLLSSNSGLTLDLEQDALGGYARIAFADLRLNATLGGLVIGNSANQKLGSLGLDLVFQDEGSRQNWLKLRPGGDPTSGLKGIGADLSWNMRDSSVSLTDNGNSLWFSGLRTHGSGQITLDLTKNCAAAGPGCHPSIWGGSEQSGYAGHFDGLRVGLSNVKGSYSFDGLRVGSPDAPLQGGTELLVLMEIFPAFDFNLNGQLTLLPGGAVGDGLTYNADFYIAESRAAITVDETGKGLWLDGMNYDMHFRDGSLDISAGTGVGSDKGGVELRKGTYWSKLDVSDVRWGDRSTGTSLGRIVLKRYESGSTLALSSGGAGALCVGGSGANAAACSASGGRWEDRGDEGVSVKLKSRFVRDGSGNPANSVASNEKRNQVIWETKRNTDANGKPINGTGSQLVVDNFYTADGDPANPDRNDYGLQVDLNLDVAPTKVKIKSGPNAGSSVSPDPLGFAVNGQIRFKEINVDRVQNVHPVGGASTAMFGIKAQNADIRANLTATPIN